jgi:lipopolysaccharide export LptBFGC system permease protein LptF
VPPPPYVPGAFAGAVPRQAPRDAEATAALVLGILGLPFFCPVLGPAALFLGYFSGQRIRRSGGTLSGAGLATAGFVLGIIGTAFLVLVILFGVARAVVSGISG